MKNKGFTLVELITTFALSSIIVILLIRVIVVIKNIYFEYDMKTELIVNQGNLSKALNSKFTSDNVVSYSECDEEEFCYSFVFSDGTTAVLKVSANKIQFGNYTYKLSSGSIVNSPTIEKIYTTVTSTDVNNNLLIIDIPINNKLYPNENFGVKVVYQYNSNKTGL